MHLRFQKSGHSHIVAFALVAAVGWFVRTSPASAQPARERAFNGVYVTADVGTQHIIAGSLVDAVDTLQEDSRVVASFAAGVRGQVRGFVLGGELGLGRADGDLMLSDPARQLTVDYRNNFQRHWAFTGGHTIGPSALVYGYLSEVTRTFDVTIRQATATTEQRDQQGLLRFGVGVEFRIAGPLRVRATAGTSRANFGDRVTNITIGRTFEGSAGMVVQF